VAVIDSHVHAWGPDTVDHPWTTESIVESVKELPVESEYTAEVLLEDMDDIGVDEAFVVGLPVTHWLDNWYIKKIASEYNRLYGIGLIDPFADDAVNTIHDLMTVDDVIGFRLATVFPRDSMYEVDSSSTTETDWLLDAIDETDFWEACADTDATVTLLSSYKQNDQVQELVDVYPELTYVIDHFGRAGIDVPPDDPDFAQFIDLCENENVLVKASAIPELSNEEYPHQDMGDRVRWLLDNCGRDQVAWGSDYQFISPHTDYESCLTCLDRMDALSTGDVKRLTERTFKDHVGV